MYHALVRRIARANFDRVTREDYKPLLAGCAADVRHRFAGRHALGGERRGRDALRRWLGRLGRLGPQLRLTPEDIWVKGWPHDTTVIVRWSATDTRSDGSPYRNRGVHIIRMRWGKVVDIDAHEDSQAVAEHLDMQAAAGIAEAAAPPIVS